MQACTWVTQQAEAEAGLLIPVVATGAALEPSPLRHKPQTTCECKHERKRECSEPGAAVMAACDESHKRGGAAGTLPVRRAFGRGIRSARVSV